VISEASPILCAIEPSASPTRKQSKWIAQVGQKIRSNKLASVWLKSNQLKVAWCWTTINLCRNDLHNPKFNVLISWYAHFMISSQARMLEHI
jgi:hypothetical protein